MRLLIVEDEPRLREQLRTQLAGLGYAVDAVADGEEGLFLGREYPIDLALIDLGLPDMSGMELIRRLRAEQRDFPILILTARGRWQDKVEGLEAGADDYLVKPVHPEELNARVHALLRRATGRASSVSEFGAFRLDTAAQQVSMAGQSIDLTGFEYRLLEYLVLNAGRVVSKTELIEHLYDQDYDRDSNVLEVLIGRLRRKLDPDAALKPIQTLRGRGYRFALESTER